MLYIKSLLFITSLSLAAVDPNLQSIAKQWGASKVAEVTFDKGSAAVTAGLERELSSFIAEAKKKGAITEVHVLAWSDEEYPPEGQKLTDLQRDLAEKRADNIENFLEDRLDLDNVETVSMAERPDIISKTIKTDSARLKSALEKSGAAPRSGETGIFSLKGKAQKAVLMVYYK